MSFLRKIAQKERKKSFPTVNKEKAALPAFHPFLYLQKTAGNHAVGHFIQSKLKVNEPHDAYEQEADRVTEQVIRMPKPAIQSKFTCPVDQSSGCKDVKEVQTSPLTTTPQIQRQTESTNFENEENLVKKSTNLYDSIVMRWDEGESIVPNIFNRGIGTVDNKSTKTFPGNASQGKGGTSQPVLLEKGKWGDNHPIPGPSGEKLNDIDFVFPTKDAPINGKTDGAFKIGSNNATIVSDQANAKNSKIDDYENYLPHDEAKDLVGYPVQEEAKQQSTTTIQRMVTLQGAQEQTERTEDVIQSKSITAETSWSMEAEINSVSNGGLPLPDSVRAFFEPRMNIDFSKVRLHIDAQAAKTAGALKARAFTIGNDIIFGEREFAPETTFGKKLLAHELTHTIQQNSSPSHGSDVIYCDQPEGTSSTAAVISPESQAREEILDDMTRQIDLSRQLRARIITALQAFSLGQLRSMQRAGVRFWGSAGLPPSFEGVAEAPLLRTPARYLQAIGVIQVRENAGVSDIRHELAHAWDNIRALRPQRMQRLDEIREDQLSSEIERRAGSAFWSGSTTRVELTLSQMLQRYRDRLPRRELAFDNPGTREGHSLTSVQEFYAEGYSVFHGTHQNSQARLLHFAPELYFLLESEAQTQHLPIPNRAEVERAMQEQGLR